MGIPRLLNYLIERYPCLSETSKANKLPQYDNLYIDMNFLIHNAVPSPECGASEKSVDVEIAILDRLLTTIETLFRLIRPTKLLFLATDGVAPRAKWNKQRQRRFFVAAEESHLFDSNSISPGTEFMQRLDVIVNDFITTKISEDKTWQNCRVVFSGSNTPGEGSHKIVEYMRHLKTTENYSSKTKHCIFSGDTDLLMMGIAVHEIYVTLLQNVKRRANAEAAIMTSDINHEFRVIHIEHLREYIEMEFSACALMLPFKFNMDDLVDDWVLMCFLIGNDFLPHLPNFHVDSDILPILYDTYKRVLPKLDGYINERGRLTIRRFNVFLNELKKNDFNICKKHKTRLQIAKAMGNGFHSNVDDAHRREVQVTDADWFSSIKSEYYREKDVICAEKDIRSHATDYVSTLQWLLSYYYTGECAWNWYYPCHYAPFVSDFPEMGDLKFDFGQSGPALPFEHLLHIQPIKGAYLLPQPIRALMEKEMARYFPTEVAFDFNEKMCEWERLALLPFINTDEFGAVIHAAHDQLTEAEKKRNMAKPMIQYEGLEYEDDVLADRIELPMELFSRHAIECIPIRRTCTFDPTVVNFSHLKYLLYSNDLEKSLNPHQPDRLLIDLSSFGEGTQKLEKIAEELLNKNVSIGWPRVRHARVVSLSSSTKKITWCDEAKTGRDTTSPELLDEFKRDLCRVNERATAQGVRIGPVEVIAYVEPVHWRKFVPDTQTKEYVAQSMFEKGFLVPVAAQTLIRDDIYSDHRSRLCARGQIKLGSLVFLLRNRTYHGQRAYILGKKNLDSTGRVTTYVHVEDEPDFSDAIGIYNEHTKHANEKIVYREPMVAAQSIGIGAKSLAQLTGNVFVFMTKRGEKATKSPRKINIGLQLKPRNQANSMNDFVKNVAGGWSYSQAATDLVNEYLQRFPHLAEVLNSSDIFVSDFAPNHLTGGKQYTNEILRWLAQHPKVIEARTKVAGKALTHAIIEKIAAAVDAMPTESGAKIINLDVKWENLYIPDMDGVFVSADPNASFRLFDRVIVVRSGYPVPIGAKGTVVAISSTKHYQTNVSANNLASITILMDKSFKRLTTTECDFKETRIFYVRTSTMLMNITDAKR